MKKTFSLFGACAMLCIGVQAQTIAPTFLPGKIAVFKAGTVNTNWPMITSRVAPVFVQEFDPALTNQSSTNALISVSMSTTSSVPGSVWINHHAGSEGGGISRSVNRQYLALEGYTGNILSPTAAKPSTDGTVYRGIVTLDAFTNAVSVYSSQTTWFGIPVGAAVGTQDNPTGIASTDGTNFWGTGNFAGTSGELDGTLFYNPTVNDGAPVEVQNYLQAAGEARIIGGTLYVATKSATGVASGIYNFVDPSSGQVVPQPWAPNVANPYFNFAFTNLYLNWGSTFKNILNFDMDPAQTVAYGADQTFGIVKFTNNAGTWGPAPYYFSTTNIGTLKQASGNQGCFGICVDFSGPNPVIYATTMENGAATNYIGGFGVNTAQGHQNNNRLIKIVDTGVNPGTNLVAQTLAIAATTNEFFGGIDFTPDLSPLITMNPANYGTTNGGSAPFTVAADSAYALSYQWLQNGTNLATATNAMLNLTNLDTSFNTFTYQCVVTNNYGSVTSAPAVLSVTLNPVIPVITSGTNFVTSFVGNAITFAAVTASGTQPFTSYQWYNQALMPLVDDGVKYSGSTSPSLTISNVTIADSGNYYMAIGNVAGSSTTNLVDMLTVNYRKATINAGQPQSATTFVGVPTSLTASQSGGSLPITNQWYKGATLLTDTGDFSGSGTSTLTINPSTINNAGTNDTGTNYFIVVSNPGGSVTSSVASVTVLIPPALSSVSYSNQLYIQNFDSLPDPSGVSVNSFNNPGNPGIINGVAYSLANPFDFNYPVINNSYVGGLGLSALKGWYGAADTLANAVFPGVGGITRFGAQNGDQSTGGVIDFGPNDVNGGIVGTNRALGLITTSSTGSTTFALKLVNTTTNDLNYIHLNLLAELWRNNVNPRTISFGYVFDDTGTNFVLDTQSISNCTLVPGLAFSFQTNIGGVFVVDGTQPANQINLVTNNMALVSPWHTNAALWLIWSMNTSLNAGSGQGYAIDNLNVSGTTVPTTAPTAATTAATKIAANNATFNGTVNPSNGPTAYWFQYGTTASYGSFTPTNSVGLVSGAASVTNLTAGLLPGTLYHYRVVATNIAGTATGSDATFTTVALPTVTTLTASNITASSATADATINPNGGAGAYWFKYGTTASYGSFSTTNALAAGSSPVIVTRLLAGLLQGTVYHYQIVATNIAGTSLGLDSSFTTLAVTPPNLGGATISGGVFTIAFTNATGASFSVLATNDVTVPKATWPVIGTAVENPAGSGNYQFTDPNPATNSTRFYILRQP
jgi:hypothetical protein